MENIGIVRISLIVCIVCTVMIIALDYFLIVLRINHNHKMKAIDLVYSFNLSVIRSCAKQAKTPEEMDDLINKYILDYDSTLIDMDKTFVFPKKSPYQFIHKDHREKVRLLELAYEYNQID